MRGQEEARAKITAAGMIRKSCCFGMGWWGYARREEWFALHAVWHVLLHRLMVTPKR